MLDLTRPTEMRIKHTLRVIRRSMYLQPSRMMHIVYQEGKHRHRYNILATVTRIARAIEAQKGQFLEGLMLSKKCKKKVTAP